MPQPIIWKNKCYIDFMGELQLKSRFQLDLYVKGLNSVPQFYLNEKEPYGIEYKPGVLIVEKKRYFDIENRIKEFFQNPDYSAQKVRHIYNCLQQLEKENILVENKIINQIFTREDYVRYEKLLVEVMSFMVIQWLSFDMELMEKISEKDKNYISSCVAGVFYEPYQIRYEKAYLSILLKNSMVEQREAAEKFIREYAFLDNFEIDKNSSEDYELLIEKVNKESKWVGESENKLLQYEQIRKKEFLHKQAKIEGILSKLDGNSYLKFYNNLALMRLSTDEEEERHYQQARAVRNIRWLLEKSGMSIYSGMDEIERYFKI